MAAPAVHKKTLVGWHESILTGGTLTYFAALDDPHIRVEADNIICPELNHIIAAFACGANLAQARITSPSILALVEHEIVPLNVGAEPLSPVPFSDLAQTPIELVVSEAIRCRMQGGEAAAEDKVCLIWLAEGPVEPVTLPYRTVRATSTTTLTAYEWTNGAITFDQTLPAGKYAVIGMRAESAGLIAARLVFPGYPWRPGCIGLDAAADIDPLRFRFGNMGVWGEFTHDSPPTVDFLSVSADTSETVYLDIVKIE